MDRKVRSTSPKPAQAFMNGAKAAKDAAMSKIHRRKRFWSTDTDQSEEKTAADRSTKEVSDRSVGSNVAEDQSVKVINTTSRREKFEYSETQAEIPQITLQRDDRTRYNREEAILWVVILAVALEGTIRNWACLERNYALFTVIIRWILVAFSAGNWAAHRLEFDLFDLGWILSRFSSVQDDADDAEEGDNVNDLHVEFTPTNQLSRNNPFRTSLRRSIEIIKKDEESVKGVKGMFRKIRPSDRGDEKRLFRLGFSDRLDERNRFGLDLIKDLTDSTRRKLLSSKEISNPHLMKRLILRRSGKYQSSEPPVVDLSTPETPVSRPKPKGASPATVQTLTDKIGSGQTSNAEYAIGMYALEDPVADTLDDVVELKPLFKLRGIDVFLTDDADEEMSTHPFLIKNGLRDVPTFIVNLATPWGNVLLYFEMPEWIKNFGDSLDVQEDDSDSIVALKRFLRGDEKYRRDRIKMIPSVVKAPLPIRAMNPRGELLLQRDGKVENTYRSHESGKPGECPTMELTLNLMANKAIRGMASLMKRYSSGIVVDLAAIVSKPADSKKEEPVACLGIWRLSHLDVNECPQMPDRYVGEGGDKERGDIRRASKLVQMSYQ